MNVLVAVCAQKALIRCKATWLVSPRPFGSHAVANQGALRKWTNLKELLDTLDALFSSYLSGHRRALNLLNTPYFRAHSPDTNVVTLRLFYESTLVVQVGK